MFKLECIPDKKRNAPLRFSHLDLLLNENVYCHVIFVSGQILLKLKCGVDEHLYLPCVCTKPTKANSKVAAEALIQRYCLDEIPNMFTFAKNENDTYSLYETTNVLIDAYLLFQKSIFISKGR